MRFLAYRNRHDLVEQLGITGRTRKRLHLGNIKTIEQLCQRSESELLSIPGLGKTSLREIKRRLHDVYGVGIMCPIEDEPMFEEKNLALRDYFAAKVMEGILASGYEEHGDLIEWSDLVPDEKGLYRKRSEVGQFYRIPFNAKHEDYPGERCKTKNKWEQRAARYAYEIADYMLEERDGDSQ